MSALTTSVHASTHIDAPLHYGEGEIGIDLVPLEALIGPARVVTLRNPQAVTLREVQGWDLRGVTRLLIHTRNSSTPDHVFDHQLVHIEPDAAEAIGQAKIRLIGTDAASVDPATNAQLPAHHTFLKYRVIIMENLQLSGVPDGNYELIALPLRISNCDAAPARVVLRTL